MVRVGISTALDTLASQAYGAGDRPGCLAWCVSATVVMSLIGLPMALGLLFAQPVAAVAFRQPPDLAQVRALPSQHRALVFAIEPLPASGVCCSRPYSRRSV